jgi:hypothetical protein
MTKQSNTFYECESFKLDYQTKDYDKGANRIGKAEVKITSGENIFKYDISFEGTWTGQSKRKVVIKDSLEKLESFANQNEIDLDKLRTKLDAFHSRIMDNLDVI